MSNEESKETNETPAEKPIKNDGVYFSDPGFESPAARGVQAKGLKPEDFKERENRENGGFFR